MLFVAPDLNINALLSGTEILHSRIYLYDMTIPVFRLVHFSFMVSLISGTTEHCIYI